MRITTGMSAKQYMSNLNSSASLLNKLGTTSYDFRAFEKPSDDPFLAGQTFQVRRQLALNEDYSSNISSVKGAVSSAESTLLTVSGILRTANDQSVLKGINGDMDQTDRNAIATQLETMQDSIVSAMNAQYGNRYLFSGAGGYGDAPFSVDSSGNLLYRGINVDTGENTNGASVKLNYNYTDTNNVTTTKSLQINFGKENGDTLNGYTISLSTGGSSSIDVQQGTKTITVTLASNATKGDLQTLLQSKLGSGVTISGLDEPDVKNDLVKEDGTVTGTLSSYVNLDDLAQETCYVDIGLGLKTEDGKVVDQSAYNAAMPGINYIGYGTTTEDGVSVSKNVYSLLTTMANMLRNSSLNGTQLTESIQPYMDSFSNTQDTFSAQLAELGTKETFLDSTNSFVTDVNLNLNEKDEDVEYVEPSNAILNYSMQKFCYKAALQIGTNLLQPTLLDFMS